ncbi:hypothetical protein JW859_14665 [bacterium]|nr:hypothetical protein [bacterium]
MIETLIVMAVTGILVTMGYSYLVSARPHADMERAELMVHSVLSDARNKALSEEIVTTVKFDVNNEELWIEWVDPATATTQSSPHTVLPDLISFEDSGIPYYDGQVSFTPRGSLVSGGSLAAGGTITLENTMGETFTFTANVATGKFPLLGGNTR